VTHRLDEVMACADRATVLSHGAKVATLGIPETDAAALARLMVGREVHPPTAETRRVPVDAPVALAVCGLRVERDGRAAVDDVSFEVRAGEILGIAGVLGNGQAELLEAIAGVRPVAAGSIALCGRDVTTLPVAARLRAGLAQVPEDRWQQALVRELSVEENTVLGRHGAWGQPLGFDRASVRRHAATLIERFDLRPPDPSAPCGALSGGNAQKLVLARALAAEPWGEPRCLLAGQPTRGVDVGAIEVLHARIRAARDRGTAILLVSADLDELRALSDRVAVLSRGRLSEDFPASEASNELLGARMAGLPRGAP
jgi:simple sugar transport system ATP-binding protein